MVLNQDDTQAPITFGDQTPAEQTPLTFSAVPPQNAVPQAAVANRAAKLDFTLGDSSPGVPTIANELQNNGDGRLTQILQDKQRLDFEQRKQDMVNNMINTQQGPVTNQQADFVRNMTQQDFKDYYSSKTPLETAYAKKYLETVAANNMPKYTAAEQQHPEATNAMMDTYQDGIVRTQIINKSIDSIQAQADSQGWGSAIADFVGSSFPLAGLRLDNVAQVPGGTSVDPGRSIEQQVSYLHSLPPNQFADKYAAALANIPNLSQKAQFAKAMLSYSHLDAAMNTGQALVDAFTVGEGLVKAGVKATGKVAETLADVRPTVTDMPGPGARMGTEINPFQVTNDATIPGKAVNDNAVNDIVTNFRKPDLFTGGNDNVAAGDVARPSVNGSDKFFGTDTGVAANDRLPDDTVTKFTGDQRTNDNGNISNDNSRPTNFFNTDAVDHPNAANNNLADDTVSRGNGKISAVGDNDNTGSNTTRPFSSVKTDEAVIRATANDNAANRTFNVVSSNDNLERVNSLFAAAADASKAKDIDLGQIAEKTGDFKTAALIQQARDDAGIPSTPDKLVRQNALSINGGANHFFSDPLNLGREALRRLREAAEGREATAGAIFDTARIERDSAGNQIAAREALYNQSIRDTQLEPLQSHLLDIDSQKYQTSLDPRTNVETLHIYLGKGDSDLFANRESAQKFADDNLGFNDTKTHVIPLRGGYVIRIDHAVPDAINILDGITFSKPEGFTRLDRNGVLKGFLGGVRNQSNVLGTEQASNRKVLAHATQRLHQLYGQVLEPYAKLKGTAMKELQVVQETERDTVNYAKRSRGAYSNSVGEFQDKFYKQWKKLPTEAQINGYYAYQQADALHFMVKEYSEVRDYERKGISQFTGKYNTVDGDIRQTISHQIRGKAIDSLPLKDPESFRVAYKDPKTGEVIATRKEYLSSAIQAKIKEITDNGGKIIQVSNQSLPVTTSKGVKHVGFFVSDGLEEGRITPDNNYRPGGHVMNSYDHYIKQPIIKDGLYLGDKSVRAVENGRLAAKLAKNFEVARNLLKYEPEKLDSYVSKNLGEGMDGNAFREIFNDKRDAYGNVVKGMDIDQPFVHTPRGKRTQDFIKFDNGVLNTQDNPYNLEKDLDRTFMGERDLGNIPSYYEEKGTIKVHNDGLLLNPAETINAAGRNLVDRRLKADYITKSSQDWLSTYQDILKQPYEQLKRNPRQALLNPEFKPGADLALLNNAQNARMSVLRFANYGGVEEGALDSFRAKIGDWFYNKTDRQMGDILPNALLPFAKDPAAVARSIAFHEKLGLFNPAQMFLQPQTFANILALSPKNAIKSVPAYLALRTALMNPNMVEHSAGVMKAFGWKTEQFHEMFDALLKTGWHEVKGSYSSLDDIESPGFFKSGLTKFLDAGVMFFDEGEKVNRLTSFATAYLDHRGTTPTGALTNRDLQSILNRADNLSNNMSAANNAVWQKGIFAIPAQFQTYNLRLMEQYTGHAITGKEKAQLFAMHSMLFGMPTALGGAVGLWPVYQSVKSYMLDNNIPHDDAATGAVLNGIVQTALQQGGYDNDFGERYGSGGMSMIRDLLTGKENFNQLFGGASGSVVVDAVNTLIPGIMAMKDTLTDNPNGVYPLDAQTLMLPLRDISTVNNAYRMWYGMNAGKWMSKYGMAVDNVTDGESARSFLFGLTPERIKELYTINDIERGYTQGKNAALTQAEDYWRRADAAANEGDDKTFEYYNKMAKASIILSGGLSQDVDHAMQRHLNSIGTTQLETTLRQHQLHMQQRQNSRDSLN